MIPVSNDYKNVMDKSIRNRAYITIGIGIVTQEAQASAKASGSFTDFSRMDNVFKNVVDIKEYASFEDNFWKADGSQYLRGGDEYSYLDTGLTTNDFKGSVKVSFDNTYNLKGLTVNFGTAYPTEFKIKTDNFEKVYANDKSVFITTDYLGDTSSIQIIPLTMLGGEQRMRIHSMLMGIGITFNNADVQSFSKSEFISAISQEISSKTFTVTVFDTDNVFNVDDENSFINFLETKQEITTSFGIELDDGSVEWINGGKTYLSDWKSSKGKMSFTATDILSQMDDEYDKGNKIYTRTAKQEAVSILTDLGYEPDEYDIDDYLNDVTLVNPMKVARHNECLQILANACRCCVYEDYNGKIRIKSMFDRASQPTSIAIYGSNEAEWSNKDNILNNASVVYADLATDSYVVDSSQYTMPDDKNYLANTGYVSNLSNDNCEFDTVTRLSFYLSEEHSYNSLYFRFDGVAPKEMKIRAMYSDMEQGTLTTITEFTVDDIQNDMLVFRNDLEHFNVMYIEFTKTQKPKQRVQLGYFGFSVLQDYHLTKSGMYENPIGYREQTIKSVSVKVHTYKNDDKGNPKLVDDDVWVTENINSVGKNVQVVNTLISDAEHARTIAKWIAEYYRQTVEYEVAYRGEPKLECMDVIKMDSDVLNNLEAEIYSHELTYNGAFKGKLSLRRFN